MSQSTSENSDPDETSFKTAQDQCRTLVEYLQMSVSRASSVSERTTSSGEIWSTTSQGNSETMSAMNSCDCSHEEDTEATVMYKVESSSSQSESLRENSSSGLFEFLDSDYSSYLQNSEALSIEEEEYYSDSTSDDFENKWKVFSDNVYCAGIAVPKVERHSMATFMKYQIRRFDSELFPAKSIKRSLQQILMENMYGSAIIKIGSQVLRYNSLLLRLHSCVFADSDSRFNSFEFDEADVPIVGFVRAYKWLQLPEPIEFEIIMQVLQVAYQLKIDLLIDQCWNQICDPELSEKQAFDLFKAAGDYSQLNEARRYLANCLRYCFLALVGSDEYLQLTAAQVTLLLSRDSIGVNCEIEVFYSAVRWLSRSLVERMEHMHVIMRSVRFPYIPINMLFTLRDGSSWPTGPGICNADRVVLKFRQDPEMMKVLCETMVSFNMQLQNEINYNSSTMPEILLPRRWVYHTNCPFHLRHLLFPYRHNIPHSHFLDYIKTLQPIWKGDELHMNDVHEVEFDGVIERAPVLQRHYEITKIIAGRDSKSEEVIKRDMELNNSKESE